MIVLKKEEELMEEHLEEDLVDEDQGLDEESYNKKECSDSQTGSKGISKNEDELTNKLLRLQADFDNFRKRTAKEKDDIYKFAIEDFSKKLLPVIDNLERAVKSIDEAQVQDSYAEGVRMVLTQLMGVLTNEGLKEIETENVEFDPQYHHGVMTESNDSVHDNHIIEAYQKGYTFKDKVIRPAMVKICKK